MVFFVVVVIVILLRNTLISILIFYVDATSFEDISPHGISDDSSTGSRVHGKIWTLFRQYKLTIECCIESECALPASMFYLTCTSHLCHFFKSNTSLHPF